MIDGHVHLENGDLSVDYAMQFVNAAAEKGIDTLQLLDHTCTTECEMLPSCRQPGLRRKQRTIFANIIA